MTDLPTTESPVPPADEKSARVVTRLDRIAAGVLAVGLCLASGLLLAGVTLALLGYGSPAGEETHLGDVPAAVGALEPAGFYYLGLVILLATPVLRSATLAIAYARRKAWIFCTLCLVVLAVMALSIVLGLET